MRYEVNVSVQGPEGRYEHLFATDKRSLQCKDKAKKVYDLLRKQFPWPQYSISVSRWDEIGTNYEPTGGEVLDFDNIK